MRTLLSLFFILSIGGCINDKKIPGDIISQDGMRKLMWDLMRADAYVSDFVVRDSTKDQKTESVALYEQIFRMHSTTQEAFKKSLAFYESRPDLLKPITDSLRAIEKKVMEKQNQDRNPQSDTTFRKMKISNKLNPKSK